MKKNVSVFATVILCLVTAAVTYLITAVSTKNYYNSELDKAYQSIAPYSKILEIDSYVKQYFIGETDDEKLQEGVYQGYFNALGDRFSMYHTKEEMDEMNATSQGNLVGIGVIVSHDVDTGFAYVRRVIDGSPAQNAGIAAGDRISVIEGLGLTAETYVEAINKVKGEEGTELKLSVVRGTETIEFTLKRATVKTQFITTEYLENDIALITISEFQGNAAADFISAVKQAQEKNVKGLIFDVRNNPGGDLEVICNVLNFLLPEGPIINVKDAKGNTVYTRSSDAACVELPMTVLVNGDTASAAELFASAIRDYQKGKLVGEKTYGKGTMQHIIPLSDGSGVRISCYYYNPPYGESYNNIGISPDIEVKLDDYYKQRPHLLNKDTDTQLQKAIEQLTNTIKGDK